MRFPVCLENCFPLDGLLVLAVGRLGAHIGDRLVVVVPVPMEVGISVCSIAVAAEGHTAGYFAAAVGSERRFVVHTAAAVGQIVFVVHSVAVVVQILEVRSRTDHCNVQGSCTIYKAIVV